MGDQQKVDRLVTTRQRLDKQKDPWEWVPEEVPTTTVKVFARNKFGTLWDPGVFTPGTPMIMGSIRLTGSHYDFSAGTYSLRITRRSVYVGSTDTRNSEVEWRIRHSRLGTVDAIPFVMGTHANFRRGQNWSAEALGDPMRPLYSFGPGTLWSYFYHHASARGTMRVYASLEGVVG